jgi:hypothetical protein
VDLRDELSEGTEARRVPELDLELGIVAPRYPVSKGQPE